MKGGGKGLDKEQTGVQRRLWRNSFRSIDRNLGVSLHENEKKNHKNPQRRDPKVTGAGEAAPHLSVSWPRKSTRFIKAKRSPSAVISTGLIVQNILMNAD